MRRHRPRRAAAVLALTAMLFAQAAFALSVCAADEMLPSGLHMVHGKTVSEAGSSPCHDAAPADGALCAAHCQASDQTLDKHQVSVPVAVLQPVLVVQMRLPGGPRLAPAQRDASLSGGAPPPRILFQSFLI